MSDNNTQEGSVRSPAPTDEERAAKRKQIKASRRYLTKRKQALAELRKFRNTEDKEHEDSIHRRWVSSVLYEMTGSLKEQMDRQHTLTLLIQRMWVRVLKDPLDDSAYQFTDEEREVLKNCALAYEHGDAGGK